MDEEPGETLTVTGKRKNQNDWVLRLSIIKYGTKQRSAVCLVSLQAFQSLYFVINPCWINAEIMKKWEYEQVLVMLWYMQNILIIWQIKCAEEVMFSIVKSQNCKCLWRNNSLCIYCFLSREYDLDDTSCCCFAGKHSHQWALCSYERHGHRAPRLGFSEQEHWSGSWFLLNVSSGLSCVQSCRPGLPPSDYHPGISTRMLGRCHCYHIWDFVYRRGIWLRLLWISVL